MRKSTELATASVYAALYVLFIAIFPFLSFLQLNVRVANILKGLVKFRPVGVLVGNFVAVVIGNYLFSPLGYWDVVLSAPVSTALLGVAYLLGRRSFLLGLAVNAVCLGTYLSWLLSFVMEVPLLDLLPFVIGGVLISDLVFPYFLYLYLVRSGISNRWVA